MLTRPSPGNTQRPPPRRSFSHGPSLSQPTPQSRHLNRPPLPSRLSNVRSASGPGDLVGLFGELITAGDGRVQDGLTEGNIGKEVVDLCNQDEEGRPRKRVKVEEHDKLVASPEGLSTNEEDETQRVLPGRAIGFPPRRTDSNMTSTRERSNAENVARKADGTVPPAMASRLPAPKKAADFSPWIGSHPEDKLNEQVIKTGYSDKGPSPSQTEGNSARPTIWPNLSQKNNIALQTLSHLFTQVLEKRQTLGRCNAPSSFKPPPRVTVTDTKREAWLRDLANPNVPLRRQSRTIPHGIRGKLLMEQCLSKSVPLQRAIWLAKCVGANELRAFRRKGVSGTAAAQGEKKWIRDWTVSVEQFLHETARSTGQLDWRKRVDYAIKLITSFFNEGLLENHHFLDWVVSSFSTSSLDQIPLWLLIVQIYWRHIIAFARRARRLGSALLEHLSAVVDKGHCAFDTIKIQLHKLLAVLAVHDCSALVNPNPWEKHQALFESYENGDSAIQPGATMANIRRRNERLASPLLRTTRRSRSPLVELYGELDNTALDVDVVKFARKCLSIVPNHSELILALFRWAGTKYRRGHARVYLTAKLISSLHQNGFETDVAILSLLRRQDFANGLDANNIYAVIIELVKDDSFSIGRYLQWLIASGAISNQATSKLATGLLASLSPDKLPRHLKNTRLSLLDRLGVHHDHDHLTDKVTHEIEHALAHSAFALESDVLNTGVQASSKYFIGAWVRARFTVMSQEVGIALPAFCVFRQVLEQIQDIDTLSVLITAATQTDDFKLLASLADTTNSNAMSLSANDQLLAVVDGLLERYAYLRTQQPPGRISICSLRDLVKRIPSKAAIVNYLSKDLLAYEQQNQFAACSPASDSLIGMHAGSLERDEEIDAVFNSGNSMDEQLMQRVFVRIVQRAQKQTTSPITESSRVCLWLEQLRTLDEIAFETLARNYLTKAITDVPGGPVPNGVYALLSRSCPGLRCIADAFRDNPTPHVAAAALRLFAQPIEGNVLLSVPEQYHYRQQQAQFCREYPSEVCSALCKALEDPQYDVEAKFVVDLTMDLALTEPDILLHPFKVAPQSDALIHNAGKLCKMVLNRELPVSPGHHDIHLTPQSVAEDADALNIAFCAGWLQFFAQTQAEFAPNGNEQLIEAITKAIESDSPVWPQLLGAAKPVSMRAVYEWAQDHVLGCELSSLDKATVNDIARYCTALDVTCTSTKEDGHTSTNVRIADKLRALDKHLGELTSSNAGQHDAIEVAMDLVKALLHVATLHSQTAIIDGNDMQSRVSLLSALCAIMVNPAIDNKHDMADYIYDVASVVVDTLPMETANLARIVDGVAANDKRMTTLFGETSSLDAWLVLATKISSTGTQPLRNFTRQPSQVQAGRVTPGSQTGQGQTNQPMPTKTSVPQQRQSAQPADVKYSPYVLRRWEVMPDPTPVVGENDSSIGLALFGTRKV